VDLIDTVYLSALDALRRCCGPSGLQASGRLVGHHQVWARDAMIAALGARYAKDAEIQCALRASIDLLRRQQAASGAIPNNVDPATLRPNFRAYADGGLWWIVGSTLLAPDPAAVRTILHWYECQDVDQSGLLSTQEASDWQDLFCTRGKGLYLNCLYVLTLRCAAKLFAASHPEESRRYLDRAGKAAAAINELFWYGGDGNLLPHNSHTFSTETPGVNDSLGRRRRIPEKRHLRNECYYLPYLAFRTVGEWFDSLANLMAIVAGVAGGHRAAAVLDFISRHDMDQFPLPSLTPAVEPGDPDWRDYYGELNQPHHYHNGGVWPFIGGFYVVALVAAGRCGQASAALVKLAELNRCGEFNEWHHGRTGEPMGVSSQAWSAGMYIFACECVRRGRVELDPGDYPSGTGT
jgi:glycogen debranching enzyme